MKLDDVKRKYNTLRRDPRVLILKAWRLFEPIVSDEFYLKVAFRLKVGYWPNFKSPQTFNEKLQWLKLNNVHYEYTKMVDKVAAKEYVANVIGDKYIIPTIGVWNTVEEIDWDALPEQFVVKASHDSGGIFVCKDKSQMDIPQTIALLCRTGKKDYTKYNKEYPYYKVPHRFIVEKYMEDESGIELKDYKFFCFNGKVRFFKVDFNRYVEHHANYYSMSGELLPFGELAYPPLPDKRIDLPVNLNEMIGLAEILSKDLPFIRVDLYNVKGKIYFGELTFFPASGMGKFTIEEWDNKIGEYLDLSKISN